MILILLGVKVDPQFIYSDKINWWEFTRLIRQRKNLILQQWLQNHWWKCWKLGPKNWNFGKEKSIFNQLQLNRPTSLRIKAINFTIRHNLKKLWSCIKQFLVYQKRLRIRNQSNALKFSTALAGCIWVSINFNRLLNAFIAN